MQKEYDLTKLKVKRRGLLADLPLQDETSAQLVRWVEQRETHHPTTRKTHGIIFTIQLNNEI